MAGIVINLPWAKGDQFWVEGVYSVGAVSYTGLNYNSGQISTLGRFNGGNLAAAWAMDGIFGNMTPAGVGLNPSGIELTTAWALGVGVQHYWTPALRSSVFATYTAVDYSAAATAMFCSGANTPIRNLAGANPVLFNNTAGLAGCNPDFNWWAVGTRTIWNPVPNLDIGLEIIYSKIETNYDPNLVRISFAGAGGRAQGLYTPSSEEVWSGVFRVQRNFWP